MRTIEIILLDGRARSLGRNIIVQRDSGIVDKEFKDFWLKQAKRLVPGVRYIECKINRM